MSYGFEVFAATKHEVRELVAAKLAEMVKHQPCHELGMRQATAVSDAMLDLIEQPDGYDVRVSVHSSIALRGSYPDSHEVASASVSASAWTTRRDPKPATAAG